MNTYSELIQSLSRAATFGVRCRRGLCTNVIDHRFDAAPEGGDAELRQAMNEAQADAKLEELKAELGLSDSGEAAPTAAPEAEGQSTGTAN